MLHISPCGVACVLWPHPCCCWAETFRGREVMTLSRPYQRELFDLLKRQGGGFVTEEVVTRLQGVTHLNLAGEAAV